MHDNTKNIKELAGLPGLTIEGYSGFAGDPGSNVFIGSKTGVTGTYLRAGVDTDSDGILDSIWYIKASQAYENDFVLINEYNTLSTYVIKYYIEDSSGNGNYNIPSWMINSISTSSAGNPLVLVYLDRCAFNISTVNYRNNLNISVYLESFEREFIGWDYTYPTQSTTDVYRVTDEDWEQLQDASYNLVVTSMPGEKNCSQTFLKFRYDAEQVSGRNMKIIAQFSKVGNVFNGTPDSIIYAKGIPSSKTYSYTSAGLTPMGYIPNYDSSTNFDNEDLGDFVVVLKKYDDEYSKEDCNFYLPYEKIADYIVEIYVYLQTADGLEEKIYLGETTVSNIVNEQI